MSLNNVDSASGALIALADGGSAVSLQKTQETGANISESAAIPSKVWAIPDMTSNTSPSGMVSSNYEHYLGAGQYLYAFKAFDRTAATYWLGLTVGDYLQYESPTPMEIDAYDIVSRSDSNAAPATAWDIHISDDGVNWTLVDSRSGQNFTTRGERRTYNLSQKYTTNYIKYTVVTLSALWSNQSNVAEFSPFATIPPDTDTLKTNTPIENGEELIIVKADNSVHRVIADGVYGTGPFMLDTTAITAGEVPTKVYKSNDYQKDFSGVENAVANFEYANISISKENSTPSKISDIFTNYVSSNGHNITVTQEADTSLAWKAFNGVIVSSSGFWAFGDHLLPVSLIYEFPSPVAMSDYNIYPPVWTVVNRAPRSWNLYGSSDNTNWVLIDSVTGISWSTEFQAKNFVCDVQGPTYKYFKLEITEANVSNDFVYIQEIQFNGSFVDSDILISLTEIVEGDKLVIVKDDNSVHEVLASGVTGVGPYTMDTAAITAGEVPTRVFRVNDNIEFNNEAPPIALATFTPNANVLNGTIDYSKILFSASARTFETKVNLSTAGNKLIDLSVDILKKL